MFVYSNLLFLLALGVMSWCILCYIHLIKHHIDSENESIEQEEEIPCVVVNNTINTCSLERCMVSMDSFFSLLQVITFCVLTLFFNKIIDIFIKGSLSTFKLKKSAVHDRILVNEDFYEHMDNSDYFDGISSSSVQSVDFLDQPITDALSFKSNLSLESMDNSNFNENKDIFNDIDNCDESMDTENNLMICNINEPLAIEAPAPTPTTPSLPPLPLLPPLPPPTDHETPSDVWPNNVQCETALTLSPFNSPLLSLMQPFPRIPFSQKNDNVLQLYPRSLLPPIAMDIEEDNTQKLDNDVNNNNL